MIMLPPGNGLSWIRSSLFFLTQMLNDDVAISPDGNIQMTVKLMLLVRFMTFQKSWHNLWFPRIKKHCILCAPSSVRTQTLQILMIQQDKSTFRV